MNDRNYIQHHGVMGMRWGVRKVRENINNYRIRRAMSKIDKQRTKIQSIQKGGILNRSKPNRSVRHLSVSDYTKPSSKNLKNMSDEQVLRYYQRLNTERQIRTLINENRSRRFSVTKMANNMDKTRNIIESAAALGLTLYRVKKASEARKRGANIGEVLSYIPRSSGKKKGK